MFVQGAYANLQQLVARVPNSRHRTGVIGDGALVASTQISMSVDVYHRTGPWPSRKQAIWGNGVLPTERNQQARGGDGFVT